LGEPISNYNEAIGDMRLVEPFYAEATDYDGLRRAIRNRIEQLNVSRSTLDSVSGLPSGYCAKILSEGEAKDPRRFGMLSLGLVLQATGLRMLLVADREALAKVTPMLAERMLTQARLGNRSAQTAKKKPKKHKTRCHSPATRSDGKRLWHGRRFATKKQVKRRARIPRASADSPSDTKEQA
jgi:hypothetical protein